MIADELKRLSSFLSSNGVCPLMLPDPITGVEQRSGWAATFTDGVGDFFKLGGNSGKVLSPSRSKALELNKLSLGKPQAEGVTAGRFGR